MKKLIAVLEFGSYWSLVLIPFSIAIAPFFSSFFIGFLFFCYFMKKLLKRERFYARTPVDNPYLLFFVISILSILNSISFYSSMKGIMKLAQYGLLFLIVSEELKDTRHLKKVVIAMLAGGVLASFNGIYQVAFGNDFIRGNRPDIYLGNLARANASFPTCNVLGVYLAPMVAVAFGLAMYYLKGVSRMLAFGAGFLILFGVYLTFSRFAGLAALMSFVIMAVWKRNKILIAVLITFLAFSPFLVPKNIKEWTKSIHYDPVVFAFNADRISIYRNTLNMISHHPFIGVGLNTFSLNYHKYKLHEEEGSRSGYSMYAHDNALQMGGEIGLIGLCVFIWFLCRLFKNAVLIHQKLKDPFLKVVSMSLTVSLIAYLINGISETNLYYARVVILFWFIIGVLMSLGLLRFSVLNKPQEP